MRRFFNFWGLILSVFLILGCCQMALPHDALAESREFSEFTSIIFGVQRDFNSLGSGYQNWTPVIGGSLRLGRGFFGYALGEMGNSQNGDEYSLEPGVGYYLNEEGFLLPVINAKFSPFFLLGPGITWADVEGPDVDQTVTVNYILRSIGFGGTINIWDRLRLWGAYRTKANKDYSTDGIAFGFRWRFSN